MNAGLIGYWIGKSIRPDSPACMTAKIESSGDVNVHLIGWKGHEEATHVDCEKSTLMNPATKERVFDFTILDKDHLVFSGGNALTFYMRISRKRYEVLQQISSEKGESIPERSALEASSKRAINTSYKLPHIEMIRGVKFSPDGSTIASCSMDSAIKLWNVRRREIEASLDNWGHGGLNAVTFNRSGSTLAAAGCDKNIRFWDIDSRRLLTTLTLTPDEGLRLNHMFDWIESLSISPDGSLVACACTDRSVVVYDIATRQKKFDLVGHTNAVCSIVFSPDGKTLASAGSDRSIRVWETATGRLINTLPATKGTILSIAFSPDGATLVSGGLEPEITLWDWRSQRMIRTFGQPRSPGEAEFDMSTHCVAFSPDGGTIAGGSFRKTLELWDAKTGRSLRTIHTRASINAVDFSPDGRYLAAGDNDGYLLLWDMLTGRELSLMGTAGR